MELTHRIPEPELMDERAQARAYSEADFAAPHQAFADEVVRRFPELARHNTDSDTPTLVDLGCGPADVTVRIALNCPDHRVVGVDAGSNMLALARDRVVAHGLDARVTFERVHLPDAGFEQRRFDAVVSNSLLHHLADPLALWRTVAAVARRGAPVAVMDLLRPLETETVDEYVDRYASDAPAILQADFRHSLCAAYRPAEVRAQLEATGLGHLTVDEISDRHLLVTGHR